MSIDPLQFPISAPFRAEQISLLKELEKSFRSSGYKHRAPNGAQTLPCLFGALRIVLRLNPAARPDSFHLLCTPG